MSWLYHAGASILGGIGGRDPHIFEMGVMGWVREILLYPVIIM